MRERKTHEENRKDIIKFLKENRQGSTIQDISSKLQLNRQTVTNTLAELKGEGFIFVREVGVAKLHFWRTGNIVKGLEKRYGI